MKNYQKLAIILIIAAIAMTACRKEDMPPLPKGEGEYSPFGNQAGSLSNFIKATGVRQKWAADLTAGSDLTVSPLAVPTSGDVDINLELQNLPKEFYVYYFVVFDNQYAIGLFDEYQSHKNGYLTVDIAHAILPVKREWVRMGKTFDIYVWYKNGKQWSGQAKTVSFLESECTPETPPVCSNESFAMVCGDDFKFTSVECAEDKICDMGKCKLRCVDTDNGKEFEVKGKVTGFGDSEYHSEAIDTCVKTDTGDAVQACPSGNCGVREFYCSDKLHFSRESTKCEFGCEDGRCLPRPDIACEDTDGGENYYAEGKTTDEMGKVKEDFCMPQGGLFASITEYSCSPDKQIQETIYQCEYGCAQDESGEYLGSCNGDGKLFTCTDSDAGLEYTVPGVAKAGVFEKPDTCWYGTKPMGLFEWTCKNSKFEYRSADCKFGCIAGACVEEESYCIDSDGGKSAFTKGTVMYRNTAVAKVDKCKDQTHVEEMFCENERSMNWEVIECDYACSDGRCIPNSEGMDLKLENVELAHVTDYYHPREDHWIQVHYCIRYDGFEKILTKNEIRLDGLKQVSTLWVEPKDITCRDDFIKGEVGKNRVTVEIDAAEEYGESAEENNHMYQDLVIER